MGTTAATTIFALTQGLLVAATWNAAKLHGKRRFEVAMHWVAVVIFAFLTIYFIEEFKVGIGSG